MRFSQRKGIVPVEVPIQTESISVELLNGLWDCFYQGILQTYSIPAHASVAYDEEASIFIHRLWHSFFKHPSDTIPGSWWTIGKFLRDLFFKAKWYEVYDFLEFVAQNYVTQKSSFRGKNLKSFLSMCNDVLERENAAYRFVGSTMTEVTSAEEIRSIEDASVTKFSSTNTHIKSALSLMSDKRKPDYRNSIKESISAVEATCNSILGNSQKTLGQALAEMEKTKKLVLHKAERSAISALYGYTSEADGIRHALLDEPNLVFEDAKFMLVTCSAFCNFMISKSKD